MTHLTLVRSRGVRIALAVVTVAALPLLGALADTGFGRADAAPVSWKLDPVHSSVGFQVRHFFTMVPGRFQKVEGKIMLDDAAVDRSSVEVTLDAASVNTDMPKRDDHLRGSDFFDVEKFPTITFKSTKVVKGAAANTFAVTGDLTMRGVTKPVTLEVEMLGSGPDANGNQRAGFSASGVLNRKDFGINWNKALDNGGLMLGEEVKLSISASAVKAAA